MIAEILIVAGGLLATSSVLTLGWGIGKYNTFRVGQQDIKTQWSNILTEYQRRADLFFNLVETTNSHKKFEKETLIGVAQARSGNFGSTKAEQMNKLKGLNGLFNRLMLVFEQYPNLKSYKQHNKLIDEIRITEDRINVARTDYNEIVGDYNKVVTMFPSNVIASIFKFEAANFFENEPETNKAPKIKLS